VTARALRLLLVLAIVPLLGASSASSAGTPATVVRLAPAQDLSVPFQCDWGYDWDERCFRDDSARLPIGGDVDKVWRAAVRFSLAGLPPGAAVQEARLGVYHDGTCIGPYGADRRCDGRAFTIDAHALLTADWFDEREVEFDEGPLARALVANGQVSGWLIWDVSDLVAAWAAGEAEAAGILLRLVDAEESWGGSGPKPPSSSFPVASRRPWLEVAYVVPEPDPRPG
jgi:hypothetical protein